MCEFKRMPDRVSNRMPDRKKMLNVKIICKRYHMSDHQLNGVIQDFLQIVLPMRREGFKILAKIIRGLH